MGELFSQDEIDKVIEDIKPYWRDDMSPRIEPDNCGNYVVMQPTSESKEQSMIDIKQYLEETNTVLLSKETFECLKEKERMLDKISAMALMTDIVMNMQDKKVDEVLDKIISEITAIDINGQVDDHTMFIRTGEQVKKMALEIIDKYKAESEGSNANNN